MVGRKLFLTIKQSINYMNDMIIIPHEQTFHLPEGCYRAVLEKIIPEFRNNGKGSQTWLKFYWDVKIPSMTNQRCTAWRKFQVKLASGSDLRNFLETWLGREYFELNVGKPFDPDALVDSECELQLVHHQGKDYDWPFVNVVSAHRVGTLELTEEVVAVDESENN